jgi:hypothetical protein
MAILREAAPRAGVCGLTASIDVQTGAETAFRLLCTIEKWPLWLSFLRSAEMLHPSGALGLGSEIVLRSSVPGDSEQLFEVDHYITNHQLSLVGAYSTRRRLDFRIESKTSRCKLHARMEYPAYGGRVGMLYEGVRSGRKLGLQLEESLTHFKHLAEYRADAKDELLADF